VEKYCRARQATHDIVKHAQCMRIHKVTNARSEFIIRNAFPLQQLLYKRASTLSCTHTVCLANCSAQFLNADDRTVLRSPPGCHIPRAFKYTIRQSFYNVHYGICGPDIPQNRRKQPQFEPVTYGLLQTEKALSISTCVHGWSPPRAPSQTQCLIIAGILN
jgi:hypothetical protein